MKHFIPSGPFDEEACELLELAEDEDIIPCIPQLLECLQDLNWPVAGPVGKRLSRLGKELIQPIRRILETDEEMWKYWIVSYLLHHVGDEVYRGLYFRLHHMFKHPTVGEINDEVLVAVAELLQVRRYPALPRLPGKTSRHSSSSLSLPFSAPWSDIQEYPIAHQNALKTELRTELAPGHVLYGKDWQILAKHAYQDDILVGTTQGTFLVHLTWSGKSEPLPFPRAQRWHQGIA